MHGHDLWIDWRSIADLPNAAGQGQTRQQAELLGQHTRHDKCQTKSLQFDWWTGNHAVSPGNHASCHCIRPHCYVTWPPRNELTLPNWRSSMYNAQRSDITTNNYFTGKHDPHESQHRLVPQLPKYITCRRVSLLTIESLDDGWHDSSDENPSRRVATGSLAGSIACSRWRTLADDGPPASSAFTSIQQARRRAPNAVSLLTDGVDVRTLKTTLGGHIRQRRTESTHIVE